MDPIQALKNTLTERWYKEGYPGDLRVLLWILEESRKVKNPDPVSRIYHVSMRLHRQIMDMLMEVRSG